MLRPPVHHRPSFQSVDEIFNNKATFVRRAWRGNSRVKAPFDTCSRVENALAAERRKTERGREKECVLARGVCACERERRDLRAARREREFVGTEIRAATPARK